MPAARSQSCYDWPPADGLRRSKAPVTSDMGAGQSSRRRGYQGKAGRALMPDEAFPAQTLTEHHIQTKKLKYAKDATPPTANKFQSILTKISVCRHFFNFQKHTL